MQSKRCGRQGAERGGFSRLDLLAVAVGVALLGGCLVTLLAAPVRATGLGACANNLRVLGQAVRAWSGDHGEGNPWRTPWGEGGSMPDGTDPWGGGNKPGSAWLEWVSMSNHLSPQSLVCPADIGKRVALEWNHDPQVGFFHANQRDNALSYPVGTDTFADRPRSILSADRHLRFDAVTGTCSARINNAAVLVTSVPTGQVAWTNNLHGQVGHFLFNDGSVERLSNDPLTEMLSQPGLDDIGVIHLLPPR